ncbi:MAG: endopeptidase La, partial [Dehalococcoidia bacterium]
MPRPKRRKAATFELPLLPRRRGILFPNTAGPILVGRRTTLRAIEEATERDGTIAVVTQRDPSLTEITPSDVYLIATEGNINRALRLPDGTTQVWVQGQRRLRVLGFTATEPYYRVLVEAVDEPDDRGVPTEAMRRAVLALFEKITQLAPSIPDDAYVTAMNIARPGWLADYVASSLDLDDDAAEDLLSTLKPRERLEKLSIHLAKELDVLELQTKIHSRVQEELDKSQREYFLREQMRAIQRELGEHDPQARDVFDMRARIEESRMPEAVARKAEDELRRLEQVPSASPEVGIIRGYLEWLVSVPWHRETVDQLDIKDAARVLDRHHYGLPKVKERILEYMAVRQLAKDKLRSPILCFVGPPGVGKTSLGRSIAEALGRRFVRVSLGGIRDEAEVRGHRRTYVGALPGRIIHAMRQAGTVNPVFMLDEVDKVGADFRGDPSSALLEVLDPEQNNSFSDHYLDVQYDLSKVMFIATANLLDPIPPALRDRMEILELPGYTFEEKLQIANKHLIPKELEQHGLGADQLVLPEDVLIKVIMSYTREAGVRNLERRIADICRAVAVEVASGKKEKRNISEKDLEDMLGPEKFWSEVAERTEVPGVATGMAWTAAGGDLLFIEATRMPGKGALTLTGQLGDVMKESAQAA